jgi:hypothetical protein
MPRTSYIRAGLAAAVKVALAALAACAFNPDGGDGVLDEDAADEVDAPDVDAPDVDAPDIDAPDIDAAIDAPIDAPIDAAIDAPIDAPTVPPLCDPNDATQRMCLTFEGSVSNGAGTNLSLSTNNVGFGAGAVGMAATLGATSHIHANESGALDVTTGITIEAFVRVTANPPSTGNMRAGIMDNNGQYGLWINTQRVPYCTLGTTVVGTAALPMNAWHHVACVYDGTMHRLYVDGVQVAAVNRMANIATTGGDGVNVGQDCLGGGAPGDPLQGGIDEVRLWSVGRSAAQIAAAAARMP